MPHDLAEAQIQRERAVEWIRCNPDAWACMVAAALAEAKAERRFSVRYLTAQVRAKSFTDAQGRTSAVNNDITPALARLLVEQCPSVAPYVELRRARCDRAFEPVQGAA